MTRVNDSNVSKSARKREHLLLQALGEKLIALPVSELESMDLGEPLFDAIVDAKSIRSHSALRRQRQLIGKLMRNADAERIEATLGSMGRGDRETNALFHSAEEWRERMCAEGAEAAGAFARLTGRDNAALPELLRELETAVDDSRKQSLRRRLFREIHAELSKVARKKSEGE